ncbi:MAG: hypothetical protein ACKVLC_10090, partial [Phycisphaerales bacterium]
RRSRESNGCITRDFSIWVLPMTLGSSKHLRDIYGLVKIDDTIDMNWLEKEIAARNLNDVWQQVDP